MVSSSSRRVRTRDIRARMRETGESYSVAARRLAVEAPTRQDDSSAAEAATADDAGNTEKHQLFPRSITE